MPSNQARIKDIKELCEQKNIDVVFYSSPLHAYTLYDVCYQGVYGELEDFKREFAKVTPFYDFSYISDEFSKDPVSDENIYFSKIFIFFQFEHCRGKNNFLHRGQKFINRVHRSFR